MARQAWRALQAANGLESQSRRSSAGGALSGFSGAQRLPLSLADSAHAFRAAILDALGYAPEVIVPGELQRFRTSDRRGDSAGWCKLFADGRAGVFGDWRNGMTETWTASDSTGLTRSERVVLSRELAQLKAARERERQAQWSANADRIERQWSRCEPVGHHDPVALYLYRRGINAWPLPACLRLHRALPYWDGTNKLGEFPAMVAPLVTLNGRVVALHRTYLTLDGRKADVPTVKKLTGTAAPLTGACIPLADQAEGVIGIAEGIETALAAWCASSVPTVAAYSAHSLASWQWPAKAHRLVIFADADEAGREAADTLRARALAARLRADVLVPSDEGADWCDVWAQRGVETLVGSAA